jgi:hypothetical protein
VTRPSNNKVICNLLVTSRLQSDSRVAIYALAQSDHFNIGFPSREALALPNPVSVGQRYVRVTDQGSAIEHASMQILRKRRGASSNLN